MTDTHVKRAADLDLVAVRKRFGEVQAVNGVSLKVATGEFVTLLGASGSGKSTTLMIIAGFQRPDEGRILFSGDDVTDAPPYDRDVGIVFQHYALFPHLTVEKNIAFPLEMRRIAKPEIVKRVAAALELVRLGGYGSRLPDELSGGQQQRVALARALVFEPPILLLDEPLGALDKRLREEMQDEIRQIQQKLGITTISVTHDQQEAMTMSDRVVVMNAGRIEQVGAPGDVYERPRNRFVAEFMGATNFVRGQATAERGLATLTTQDGTVLKARCDEAFPRSGPAEIVVRPERVVLERTNGTASGGLTASILNITYVGDCWRFKLRLRDGGELTATRVNTGKQSLNTGDEVRVSWHPEDAWIVPASRT